MAVMNVNYVSKYLKRYVEFKVILPIEDTKLNGIEPEKPVKYKTIYLLNGFSGDSYSWLYGSRIFKLARDRNLAVVMPAGENSFYADQVNGNLFGKYVGEELVEITRKMFPLSDRREDTFIGGLSMGGYGSLLIGCRFSDTFGGIISLSGPVFLPDTPMEKQLIGKLPVPRGFLENIFGDLNTMMDSANNPMTMVLKAYREGKLPRIYMACGTEDYVYDNVCAQRKLFEEEGIQFTYEEGPGEHEWDFWDKYIEKAIDWYLEGK